MQFEELKEQEKKGKKNLVMNKRGKPEDDDSNLQ